LKKDFHLDPGLLEWSRFRDARKDQRRLLVQPTQTLGDTPQLRQPSPFRPCTQRLVLLFPGLRLEGLTEQVGLADHALAFGSVGLAVMLVPDRQLPGGQRFALQGGQQRLGVFAVGARQRGQHPGGRPGGKLASADGAEQRLGQLLHQTQATADPTDIPTGLPGHLPLGQFKPRDQFPNDGPLFDRLPGTALNADQNDQQGLGDGAIPQFHLSGVPGQPAQGFEAQIAVDQYPPLRLLGHRHQRDQLTVLLDGAGQTLDQPGLSHPQGRKAQIQAVQIRFQGLVGEARHGSNPTRTQPPWR